MEEINKKHKILNLGAALIVGVIVICIAVTVTVLARPLYYFDIEHLKIHEASGYSEEECRINYDSLIEYNLIGGESELTFPTLHMSEEGRIHFEEVKSIFIAMQILALLGIVALAAWIVYLRKKGASKGRTLWMRLTGIVTLALAVIVALAMLIDWQWAFETMHKIFFQNDYWIFNSFTDPVIKILPDTFFFHCGILIIILVVIQLITLELLYRRLNNGR